MKTRKFFQFDGGTKGAIDGVTVVGQGEGCA